MKIFFFFFFFFFLDLLSLQIAGDEIWTLWSEMNQNRTFHIPKSVSIILPTDGWLLNFLATGDVGRFQATLWASLSGL
jgi:hypothetical protein